MTTIYRQITDPGNVVVSVGCGYKQLTDQIVDPIVPDIKSSSQGSGYMSHSSMINKSEVSSKRNTELGSELGIGYHNVKIDAELEFKSQNTNSEKKFHCTLHFVIKTHDDIADEDSFNKSKMKAKLDPSELSRFYDLYGDYYVSSVSMGGSIRLDYDLDEEQHEKLRQYKQNLGLNAADLVTVKQKLQFLKDEKIFNNLSTRNLQAFPPIIEITKLNSTDEIEPTLDAFVKELNKETTKKTTEKKTEKASKTAPIAYRCKPYYNHPVLQNNKVAATLFNVSNQAKVDYESLSKLLIELRQLKENAGHRYYVLSGNYKVSDLSYDRYKTNRNKITKWITDSEEILTGLRANIFAIKQKKIQTHIEQIRGWLAWPRSRFAVNHILVHVVNPMEKTKDPMSYKFKGRSIPLMRRGWYLYIDVLGGNDIIDKKVYLKIQHYVGPFGGYHDLYGYVINGKTAETLKQDPCDEDELPYIATDEIIDKDIKLKLYKLAPDEITLYKIHEPCILRIYLTPIYKPLGHLQNLIKVNAEGTGDTADPTDPTDPTEPTEPTEPTDPTDAEDSDRDDKDPSFPIDDLLSAGESETLYYQSLTSMQLLDPVPIPLGKDETGEDEIEEDEIEEDKTEEDKTEEDKTEEDETEEDKAGEDKAVE
jgi:hypothetical protein